MQDYSKACLSSIQFNKVVLRAEMVECLSKVEVKPLN